MVGGAAGGAGVLQGRLGASGLDPCIHGVDVQAEAITNKRHNGTAAEAQGCQRRGVIHTAFKIGGTGG